MLFQFYFTEVVIKPNENYPLNFMYPYIFWQQKCKDIFLIDDSITEGMNYF